MCSERTEKSRLRRAILSPFSFQNVSSSGSHRSIQRPPRRAPAAAVMASLHMSRVSLAGMPTETSDRAFQRCGGRCPLRNLALTRGRTGR